MFRGHRRRRSPEKKGGRVDQDPRPSDGAATSLLEFGRSRRGCESFGFSRRRFRFGVAGLPEAVEKSFVDSGKFASLDAKLAVGVAKAAQEDLGRTIDSPQEKLAAQ